MATMMLLVLSSMCLMAVVARHAGAAVAAPVGAAAAVAASFLATPPGPFVVPVALATGLVAAFGFATVLGLLAPPAHASAAPHH